MTHLIATTAQYGASQHQIVCSCNMQLVEQTESAARAAHVRHVQNVTTPQRREIWTTTTRSGQTRYYYFSRRTFPMRKEDALAMLANDTARLVQHPWFVG